MYGLVGWTHRWWCGSTITAGTSPSGQDAADVRRLADVLGAVVDDRHQPHPERHGWVPSAIDDAVELGGVERGEQLGGAGTHGVVVAGERVGPLRPHRRDLLGRVPVAGVVGIG